MLDGILRREKEGRKRGGRGREKGKVREVVVKGMTMT